MIFGSRNSQESSYNNMKYATQSFNNSAPPKKMLGSTRYSSNPLTDEFDTDEKPRKQKLMKNTKQLKNARSLRDLAEMEDQLSEQYGENFTEDVNTFWKEYYKTKFKNKEKTDKK